VQSKNYRIERFQINIMGSYSLNLLFMIMKIINIIFEKGEVPSDLKKALIKPHYKKGDKSELK